MKLINVKALFKIIFFVAIFIALESCKSRKKVDVSNIELNLKIIRFEKKLFSFDPEKPEEHFKSLQTEYPDMFSLFVKQMMGFDFSAENSTDYSTDLIEFLTNPYMEELYEDVQAAFPDIEDLNDEIELALKHYLYYFPDNTAPEVYTFISGFNYAAFTLDTNYIGIGLDMYLGRDYKYYPSVFPHFLYRRFEPEYISSNVMRVLAAEVIAVDYVPVNLLGSMIYNGALLYFTDLTLPDVHDTLKIGYTEKEYRWAHFNEPEIWTFFIDKELLYETNSTIYSRYITEGPSTSGMPVDAPGNMGSWVGWQIVRSFMEKNPDVHISSLLTDYSPQYILENAAYRPRSRNVRR
ncbi:MAG: hypothetical protein EA412_06730 [Chitinophagaceae bacterium]|nr:MAG: hypothetical protein EA412_06730 [Chitinophagaceae bacterium]